AMGGGRSKRVSFATAKWGRSFYAAIGSASGSPLAVARCKSLFHKAICEIAFHVYKPGKKRAGNGAFLLAKVLITLTGEMHDSRKNGRVMLHEAGCLGERRLILLQ